MRKIGVVVFGALLLTGCATGNTNVEGEKTYIHEDKVHVGDRVVTCLTWKKGQAGGLDCDWDSAR